MPVDLTELTYAAAVTLGGVLGYVKAKSIPSLGAGLLFGSALTYGTYQMSQDRSNVGVFLGTSAVLAGVMGYRYYNTGKIMPAGLISAVSVLMIVRTLAQYYQFTRTKSVKM